MDPSAAASQESGAGVGQAREILRQHFGHEAFLPGQEAALHSIMAGRNLLVVMPTGSGKSLLYQLPALLTDGLTLVVSPLIALMKDQVDELQRRGIAATFVNSSLGQDEQQRRLADCIEGRVRLLYVAPERIRSTAFLAIIRRVKLARMAVDEAHCISEWGHDFRPDYRRLKQLREHLGRPPVTALTATATPRVQQDILSSLGLAPAEVDVHVHGFDRPNLALSVVPANEEEAKNEFVTNFLRQEKGSGIIYVGTRRTADDLADALTAVEPRTAVYHAGMEPEDRTQAQEAFLKGRARVVVATVAFGMGIDKPDVRFVLHYHYPGSVEGYYQEIGRAGRDGLPSRCVLLYSPADRYLREFFIDLNYPTPEQVESVYETLWAISENPVRMTYKQIAELCDEKVNDGQVGSALRLLDGAGLTRAMHGDAAASVELPMLGADILAAIKGKNQRSVFEALAVAADLETPGRCRVSLSQISAACGLAEDQVRRALAALDEAGLIGYTPPFRGRGVEKLTATPPPFGEVRIDWERQELLRGMEEEKLRAMEDYIHTRGCRRGYIVRYFGEKQPLRCGVCDRCEEPPVPRSARPTVPSREEAGTAGQTCRRTAGRTDEEIRAAALRCVADIEPSVGTIKVAEVLTGSKAEWITRLGADQLAVYATIDAKRTRVLDLVRSMIAEGLFQQDRRNVGPVLELTELGWRELERLEGEGEAPAEPPLRAADGSAGASPSREKAIVPRGASETLDDLIDQILVADREEAKALLDDLRLFHPREVARRLHARYLGAPVPRERARAAWAAGELCGEHGVDFLVACTRSEIPDVRRLAASALGKIADQLRPAAERSGSPLSYAGDALRALAADPVPQVRQYAAKALAQLPPA